MRSELRQRKLDRAFGQMDVHGYGEVERADLLGLGARLLVGFGQAPTSPYGRRIVEDLDRIWTLLTTEGGDEKRLTREQFHERMAAALIEGDRFGQVCLPAARAVAELCDEDGDGLVGPAEFRMMLSAFGTPYDDIDAAFDRLDQRNEGVLTVEALVAAARELYTGDDP